jgi:hypothetical protein
MDVAGGDRGDGIGDDDAKCGIGGQVFAEGSATRSRLEQAGSKRAYAQMAVSLTGNGIQRAGPFGAG